MISKYDYIFMMIVLLIVLCYTSYVSYNIMCIYV